MLQGILVLNANWKEFVVEQKLNEGKTTQFKYKEIK